MRPKCLQTSLKCDAFLSHVDTKCRSAEKTQEKRHLSTYFNMRLRLHNPGYINIIPLFAAASREVSNPEVFTESSMSTFPNSSADIVPLSEMEPLPSSARSSSSKVDYNINQNLKIVL